MHHAIPTSASLICSSQAIERTPARAVGCFKLPTQRALTLTIRAPGELRIAHGRVWVTFGNSADDASVRAGDHFLNAGEVLRLACGQQAVMESLQAQPDSSVYFSWEPDAALSSAAASRRVQHAHAEVRQPLLDLGTALHQAAWALGRLMHGLGRSLACTLMLRRSTS
jgi:hypothetical protein